MTRCGGRDDPAARPRITSWQTCPPGVMMEAPESTRSPVSHSLGNDRDGTDQLDTHQKAVQINLDNTKYGTFAEIGAGQEVARWFFRVGGAAGTIAKSISAYDMTVSDAIYGASGRYVSRQRLETMLDYEYDLMNERLAAKRGENTRFFVFADTVATKSYTRKDNWHGWMGIRFQTGPGAEPSQIILHVSLLDRETILQQEAIGILGVNLIHAALYERGPGGPGPAAARRPVAASGSRST